ncbi:MAG: FAD-dependent oxidoreductase [Nocardioidaceae bacterium]
MSTPVPRILIIGAGTGGLCLAHGLTQAGIPVEVYERDRTRTDGLQGYRVGIDPDGSRALHDCLPLQLFNTFVATSAQAGDHSNMLTEQRTEVLSTSGWAPADPRAVASERSVSRMTLRQVLLTGLNDVVNFDKTFTNYEDNPDDTVTAHFNDGSSATGDLLVAADGPNSRVRQQYLPHATLVPTGLTGITGKVALTEQTRPLLTPKMIDGVSIVFAPKGYSCIFHVMRFPWDTTGAPKHGIGATDAELITAWPGLQFDNSRDYIMWGFAGATHNLPAGITDKAGLELKGIVEDLAGSWHPDLRTLFALTDPASCFPLNIRTSGRLDAWPTTNVTLLGDAIHTMTPGRGVGANTALRDARLLTCRLTDVRDGRRDLLTAVNDYETTMRAYANDAIKASLAQMSGNGPLHKPVIGRLALAAMRTAMRTVNHVPPLKRRMTASYQTFRDQALEE